MYYYIYLYKKILCIYENIVWQNKHVISTDDFFFYGKLKKAFAQFLKEYALLLLFGNTVYFLLK